MDGYILLSRQDDSSACGILDDASYPILSVRDDKSPYSPSSVSSPSSLSNDVTLQGSASAVDCGGGTATFDSSK